MSKAVGKLVVVSDTHCGCKFGLIPPEPFDLTDGGTYTPSALQKTVWSWWRHFWDVWVPQVTKGEPYAVLVNGDAVDGVHHNSVTQVTNDLEDQKQIAMNVFKPIAQRCEGRLYWVTGTEAHVGSSGMFENGLAKSLGAIKDKTGRYARYELWANVGKGLVHATHHIGTTGSQHYESTAILKELIESYVEAGRNHERPPDCVVRSHRHRAMSVQVPTKLGIGLSFCTPGWQLKTPYVYRMPGGRTAAPQLGGSIIMQGDEDFYARHWVKTLDRPSVVVI